MLRRFAFTLAPLLACLALVPACSSSTDDDGTPPVKEKPKPTALPPVSAVTTLVEASFTPAHARQSYQAGPNPADPTALATYLEQGFGELSPAPGVPYVARAIDGSTPPAAGPGAKRLLRFVHLADLQLADDESPTRVGQIDSAGFTSAALRPQDPYLCRMANGAVRSINALHRKDPVAFTIMGGDNADSAQDNEVDWVLGILSGRAEVECDSGEDDDMIEGPDNDGKDAFVAEGLAMPWRWVTGNHDVLVQGNVAPNAANRQSVVGDTASNGTRDYRQGGALTTDVIPADPRRALLSRVELMSKVAGDKDGHGLGDAVKASGRATYTFDAEGTPFRFLVIDTAHDSGGSEGVIKQADVDATIKPLLDKALADGKWVVLASHHATTSLTEEGGALGSKEPDALLAPAWASFIGKYPNVLFSMVGHSHQNRAQPVTPADGGHAWWEVMTASIADYPHQLRVVEIFDQDNGWIMLRSAPVDISVENDPVAAEGRRRGVVDWTSGWNVEDGVGKDTNRGIELWIKKP